MFSNGKFKNIVAEVDVSKQIGPGDSLKGIYSLLPVRGKKQYVNQESVFIFFKFKF